MHVAGDGIHPETRIEPATRPYLARHLLDAGAARMVHDRCRRRRRRRRSAEYEWRTAATAAAAADDYDMCEEEQQG